MAEAFFFTYVIVAIITAGWVSRSKYGCDAGDIYFAGLLWPVLLLWRLGRALGDHFDP